MKRIAIVGSVLAVLVTGCSDSKDTADAEAPVEKETQEVVEVDTVPRVTGIGGVFFVADNPDSLNEWYGEHLGMKMDPFGSVFEFRNAQNAEEINYLRWSTHENNDYFQPSEKQFMINYRVNNIEGMIRNLEASGVEMLDELMEVEYGKFIHFMDPDGNKIELWEPNDAFLTEMGGETTK